MSLDCFHKFSYFYIIPSPRFDSLALQGGVYLIQTVLYHEN